MSDPIIDIILPVKASSMHVAEHVASIRAQKARNWRLNVINCGVDEQTRAAAWEALEGVEDRVIVHEREACSFSKASSWLAFFELVPDARFIVFANPQDTWLDDRISKAEVRMRGMSRLHGSETPIAIYSDFAFVDEGGAVVEESGLAAIGIDGTDQSLGHLLVQHVAYGTTMVVNRALIDKVLGHAAALDDAISFDWWLAAVGASLGVTSSISDVTVNVRSNAGAWDGGRRLFSKGHAQMFETPEGFDAICRQAGRLLAEFGPEMPADRRAIVSALASLPEKGKLARTVACLRNGLWESGRRMAQVSSM